MVALSAGWARARASLKRLGPKREATQQTYMPETVESTSVRYRTETNARFSTGQNTTAGGALGSVLQLLAEALMPFEVVRDAGGWMVRDGGVVFGPYATALKAQDSADNLNGVRRWVQLTPAELVALEGSEQETREGRPR